MTNSSGDAKTDPLLTRQTLAAIAVLSLIFGGLLYWAGRPAWCKYGFGLWAPAWNSCTSQHLFDPYALTHISHGIVFFWLLWPLAGKLNLRTRFVAAFALEIGWELLENSHWVIERYRQDTAAFDYSGDSILNAYGDLLTMAGGFAITARVPWKASVALFIALEILALLLARDNLILNIIMLVFPLEAIKQWQLPG
jgi:Protein of unknown function (DUF2585)